MLFKNLISTAYRILIFSLGRKLRSSWSPIQHFILTIPACHDRTKERSSVGKFSISLTRFRQRRQISHKDGLLQGHKTRERQHKQIGIFIFKTQKSKTKTPRPYAFVEKKELFYCDFHKKSRLRIKFTVFPTNNQP